MKLKSGHEVIPITGKDDEDQKRDFKAYEQGIVKLYPEGWVFTKNFLRFADKVYEFEYKPSDVVIMTYPKCGTTWMQEIIWTMRNSPDLNHPLASLPITNRSIFIEFDKFFMNSNMNLDDPEKNDALKAFKKNYPGADPNDGMFLQMAKSLAEPRTLKTHLPFSMLNKELIETAKIVYVARNPKDVCMSYYHHSQLIKVHDFKGSFDTFFDYFLTDNLVYSPFWKNIEEAWKLRNHRNVHFVFYEDLKSNPKREFQRLDEFLGTNLSDKQIDNVISYTTFSAMKDRDQFAAIDIVDHIFNPDVIKKSGGFFRKGLTLQKPVLAWYCYGETGSWKNKLTEEQENRMNNWIKENTKHMDIQFKYV